MNALHFGAGKIGRGLVAPVLSDNGYNVVFVARNAKQVALLQSKGQYVVHLANESADRHVVRNITAIHFGDNEAIAREIAQAKLITTAVGAAALPQIAERLAYGLARRLRFDRSPLHIIACENIANGSTRLKKMVYRQLDPALRQAADACISFPDAMIDRIVPVQHGEFPDVKVEPFCEWVVRSKGTVGEFPRIAGITVAESLDPYLERKLFTVNTGHCCAAYFGYLAGYETIQEAMKDPAINKKVYKVLGETGSLLIRKFGFDEWEHRSHIRKTMERFANPRLSDRIVRVGRSPLRKLSFNERLVQPALQACRLGIETSCLTKGIVAALLFDCAEDPEAMKLQEALRQTGIHHVISRYMGISAQHKLHQAIAAEFSACRKHDLTELGLSAQN